MQSSVNQVNTAKLSGEKKNIYIYSYIYIKAISGRPAMSQTTILVASKVATEMALTPVFAMFG